MSCGISGVELTGSSAGGLQLVSYSYVEFRHGIDLTVVATKQQFIQMSAQTLEMLLECYCLT
jgi:hypothetical protein